jgi:class 3 adenylate cyclase
VDPSGDGGGGLTATGPFCGSCGAQSSPTDKFCGECGARLTKATQSAEYKQVTVLFADVVHSMDIAAAVGAERLREFMTDLVNRAAVVVQRYGGTVGSFTGDGIMAVFSAPTALEDHAFRACLAALGIQEEAKRLAVDVRERDGVDLLLWVGLNSGQVIAGEIGSGPFGYTAVGEQVGMAQRMESSGVMLSASTARLVDGTAALGEGELVQIKGSDKPVAAQRLLGMEERHRLIERVESNLVGRRWEMSAVGGLLDRAVDGHGAVVGVVGPPGIGKSGRYTVSDAGVIDHLPDVSLFPNWEHTVVPRRATIANDRLTLELVEPLVIDGRQLGAGSRGNASRCSKPARSRWEPPALLNYTPQQRKENGEQPPVARGRSCRR